MKTSRSILRGEVSVGHEFNPLRSEEGQECV